MFALFRPSRKTGARCRGYQHLGQLGWCSKELILVIFLGIRTHSSGRLTLNA
jgi:hypothetical protein